MTTVDPALDRMTQIVRETRTAGIEARVKKLRDWADGVEALDPIKPVIDSRLCDLGIYVFAALFMHEFDDARIMGLADYLKHMYSPVGVLARIIKPLLKDRLLTAEDEADAAKHPLPVWDRPNWLSKHWSMSEVLHILDNPLR